ncbi:MAG TPA: S8 family serine peptidase, partial [Candidatus Dormibacteraeota bacterium]
MRSDGSPPAWRRADVVYVGGQDCTDQSLIAAENKVIDRHLANIVSNSWGSVGDINQLPADLQHAYTHTFIQAVVEGIGVYFSSGDSGDEIVNTGGFRTVDFPASDPWVTAVGGTSLAVGKNNNYLFETGWSTGRSVLVNGVWTPAPPGSYLYGAGGGTSEVFAQPVYQKGTVPASISKFFGPGTGIGGDTPGRAVPDVAMDADPNTGFTFGQTVAFPDGTVKYAESRIGGTSLASPLFAGMMALADMVFGAPHG